jgi:hypothetical protein
VKSMTTFLATRITIVHEGNIRMGVCIEAKRRRWWACVQRFSTQGWANWDCDMVVQGMDYNVLEWDLC